MFGTFFVPNVKAATGLLPAWVEPDVEQLKTMWQKVYGPDIKCGWEKDDPVRQLVCAFQ